MLKCKSLIINNYPSFEVKEMDIPSIRDTELLLEIMAAPFTKYDVYRIKNAGKDYRFIPGSEAIGKVKKIGVHAASIYKVSEGDLVYIESSIMCRECKYCLTGNYSVCEQQRRYGALDIELYPYLTGSMSQYMVVVPGSRVHKLSESMALESLSMLGIVAKSMRAISKKGQGHLGKSVLILGFDLLGACCSLAAKSMGLNPVQVYDSSISLQKAELAEELGISLINELGSSKYDMIIDTFGQQLLFNKAVDMVKPMGKYILSSDVDEVAVPTKRIIQNEIEILGVSDPSWDVEQALKLIMLNSEQFDRIIVKVFSLDSFDQAIKAMQDSDEIANIVVKPCN